MGLDPRLYCSFFELASSKKTSLPMANPGETERSSRNRELLLQPLQQHLLHIQMQMCDLEILGK